MVMVERNGARICNSFYIMGSLGGNILKGIRINTREKKDKIVLVAYVIVFILLKVISDFMWLYGYDKIHIFFEIISWVTLIICLFFLFKNIKLLFNPTNDMKSSLKVLYMGGHILVIWLLINGLAIGALREAPPQTTFIDSTFSDKGKYYLLIVSFQENPLKLQVNKKTYDNIIVDNNVCYNIDYRFIRYIDIAVLQKKIDLDTYNIVERIE